MPIRGCTLSCVGPLASAAKTCKPLTPNIGRMAMVNMIIPKPPIHWVILRQKRSPWGSDSMSSNMVAPVLLKPDIVSKKALVMLGIYPLI